MRKDIDIVPGHLLGKEIVCTTDFDDLGYLTAVAKGIGQPEYLAGDSEFPLKEALAIDKLLDKRFSAGNVSVCFNPGAADGVKGGLMDRFLDPVKESRIVFL
jgi:hypothetical protein